MTNQWAALVNELIAAQQFVCRDCRRRSSDVYWVNVLGKKMSQPRCSECHEQAVRRATREWMDEANQ